MVLAAKAVVVLGMAPMTVEAEGLAVLPLLGPVSVRTLYPAPSMLLLAVVIPVVGLEAAVAMGPMAALAVIPR